MQPAPKSHRFPPLAPQEPVRRSRSRGGMIARVLPVPSATWADPLIYCGLVVILRMFW